MRRNRERHQPPRDWQILLQSPEIQSAEVIASYFSYGLEPDTTLLNGELLAMKKIVLLPRMNSDRSLTWVQWRGAPEELSTDRRFSQPIGEEFVGRIDVVIVPALAVDLEGYRLGQGGGSYDRALAHIDCWKVALVNDDEISEERLPREAHDQKVDAVVTPQKLIRF